MAYNRNIPASTDLLSNSQPLIQGNFQTIDSGTTGTGIGLSRNHVTMTDATNGGLHHRVDYFAAVASPAISGFVSSAYPKTVTNIELFYKNAVADMQVTNSLLSASSGEGMLPGGLLIKSGSGSILNTFSTQAVLFTTAFNTLISIVCTPISSNTIIQANSGSTTGFTAARSGTSGTTSFYWIAIGY